MARLMISDEATFHLLSLVEQYPCLWDTGSADYSKTNLKTSVWEHIGMEMMERFPQFGPYSADSLKLLLKNKRRTFREEKKKILQTKSGQPSDDVYIGKWKFYRAMLFLDASDVNPGKRTCSDNYGETIEESYNYRTARVLQEAATFQPPALRSSHVLHPPKGTQVPSGH
ncbi:uncharacterized protein LOC120842152 [Ixodes scapularis]|uniref:uncharacterized protein LOC120842152 n=1 Tax=Ixodes scapularis TaxID=6945 RepID=UPI001A9D13ED|nr:uncharacterized protein LOC120842152 [Ixodes scapularis]